MVAGAYNQHRAPSHAERPHRQREKGKGWQRSKSSMKEYAHGSDLYFSEDKAVHRSVYSVGSDDRSQPQRKARRPQSSMSGRRTDKASTIYEIDCPGKRPQRRRASVEAIVKTAKSDTTRTTVKGVTGPPIQKRMLTVAPDTGPRACVTPNKNFYGWTSINKDRHLQQVHISEREGPKAKTYTPRYEIPGAEATSFPVMEKDEKSFKCEQRRMEMLVTTGPFTERLSKVDEVSEVFRFEGEHYKNEIIYRPDDKSPINRYVNEMHLELEDFVVPQDRFMKGFVYLDLKEPATVDLIALDVNKTFATVSSEGVVKAHPRTEAGYAPELKLLPNRQPYLLLPGETAPTQRPGAPPATAPRYAPTELVLRYHHPKKVRLNPGRHAIPFEIYVPEDEVPSFAYVDPVTGASAVNNYSLDSQVRINGKMERTGRIPIEVPALGKRNVTMRGVDRNREILIPNKYLTDAEGLDYVVGDTDKGENRLDTPDRVTAKIRRIITCPDLGRTTVWEQDLKSAVSGSGKSNDILNKYNNNSPTERSTDEWDKHYYEKDKILNSQMPSVRVGNFVCDYEILIETGTESYKGYLVKCDRYDDKDFKRTDLSSQATDNKIKKIM